MKSNSNQAVLAHLAGLGAGMDVVSGGEYLRAKAAGVPGERIVFSGVGKTAEEMRIALEGGIRQFNVESEPELGGSVAGRVLHGHIRADHHAREPGCRCAHP
jgi:diaminopimelate decarboxylase